MPQQFEAAYHFFTSPVVSVVVGLDNCGVHIIPNQPVEIGIAADPDGLHLLLGDIGTVRIEVAKDHDIL